LINEKRHTTPEKAQGGIRIEVVRVSDLTRFAEEFFRNPAGQVMAPISRQRAIGMTHNPFADPDDPGLIVAYDREKVVAHYCIVSGVLKTSEGSSKVLWGSALFVHPDYRARQVFLDLIRRVFSFQTDFVISGFTEAVHRIYKVLGFRELKPLGTCMINVSKLDFFGATLWLARDRGKISESVWKIANTVAPAMRLLVYRPLRLLYFRLLARAAKKKLEGIGFREVQRVQPRAETPPVLPHFVRGIEGTNWMLEYPWVLESATRPGSPSDPPYYFFDYREDLFRHYAIEFDDRDGNLAGYLAFSIQAGGGGNRVLNLTDFSARNKKDLATAFWVAALYAARYRVDHFEAASAMSPFMTQTPLARFLVRSGFRRYLCHAVKGGRLEKVSDQLELQYGDGDCAFT
jgi:hypothetical protein